MNTANPIGENVWSEIAQVPFVIEGFGLHGIPEIERGTALAEQAYGVKFDFVSGGPGYVGDLCIVQGDALGSGPVTLTRDRSGRLAVFDVAPA